MRRFITNVDEEFDEDECMTLWHRDPGMFVNNQPPAKFTPLGLPPDPLAEEAAAFVENAATPRPDERYGFEPLGLPPDPLEEELRPRKAAGRRGRTPHYLGAGGGRVRDEGADFEPLGLPEY